MSGISTTAYRIGALARRDAKVELSYHFQLMLRIIAVMFSVLTFFFLSRLVGSPEPLERYEGGYFSFVLIGLVFTGLAYTCISSFGNSISQSQTDGTFEILLATTAPLGTLMAGTLVVPFGLALFNAALHLGLGWLLAGIEFPLARLITALPVLLLTLGTFCAIGLLSAALIVLTKRGDPLSGLTLQASNLVAGALFPVSLLPEPLQVVARFVPAYYGLNGMREILLADGGFSDVTTELSVLAAFNVVLLPASLWVLRRAIRTARVTGTLGNR